MNLLHFIKELFKLATPSKKPLRILIVLSILSELAAIPGPFLFAWILDKAINDFSMQHLYTFIGIILILQVFQATLGLFSVKLNRQFSLESANRLRISFCEHLLHLPYDFFLNNNAGGQSNSFLNDVDDIDDAISGVVAGGVRPILKLVFYGLAILIWNPIIGILAVLVIPLTILGQRKIRVLAHVSSMEKVNIREEIVSTTSEAVANISVVKSFTMEDMMEDRVGSLSAAYKDSGIYLETYQSAMRSSANVMLAFMQYSFFIVGAYLVMIDQLGIPAFLGQILLVGRFLGPLNDLFAYRTVLVKSNAAIHRVRETMDLDREGSQESRTLEEIPSVEHGVDLQVRDLHFCFHKDLPLISAWSFDLKPGETVALVGASGSGKTTLLNLILGMFEDYTGEISLNGNELKTVRLEAIRAKCGVVFQEHILFNASVRDNLSIGFVQHSEENRDEQIWQALDLAHAADFIRELPDGLDTIIGTNGVKLSGGQRQRLALARVILRNPPLLFLDEATSALDSISEGHIQEALKSVFKDRSSLVIAHRLSTIVDADKILVIHDGQIVEQGTHQELFANDGMYQKLFEAQVEGFINWEDLEGES
ncbi:MAG: ABC transporter ATP-binding protein/permease [Lentisphaeria bacterium]|nr:ABC transporter ATP-binding protein/permease [Lentisphaeria bacterium]